MKVSKFIISMSKGYRRYLFFIFVATCFMLVDGSIKPWIIRSMINTVANNGSVSSLWKMCGYYAVLQIAMISSWQLIDYSLTKYVARMRVDIITYFLSRLYGYQYSFFHDNFSGNLSSKINDVAHMIPNMLYALVHSFFSTIMMTIVSFTALLLISPGLALGLLIWMSVFFSVAFFFLKRVTKITAEYTEEKNKVMGFVADYFINIFSIKIFARRDFEIKRSNSLMQSYVDKALVQGFFFMKFYFFQGWITSVYVIGSLMYMVKCYLNGRVSPGDFALIVMTNSQIIDRAFSLIYEIRKFVTDWSTVRQNISIFDNQPEILDKPDAAHISISEGKIVFDNVSFNYEDSDPIFQNQSIVIEPGQKVGLVGYSGSGKSSFVNLILRLYDVVEGRILIDGQDIRDVTQDSLRSSISLIPQDTSLFHRTIMENIQYGKSDSNYEEVVEAAKKAQAHDFIVNMLNGYDSMVGERGAKLSGGQRQRIVISRAVIKNSKIIIFDEATSSLDTSTEAAIQKGLDQVIGDKTTIIIAHRISTLFHMDRILVFNKGKIVEDGSHSELMQNNGLYKSLWDAQKEGFLPSSE